MSASDVPSGSHLLFGELLVKLRVVTSSQVEEALALQALTGQRVGEALLSMGYVTREQLQNALAEALGLLETPKFDRPRIGELLVGLKHVTAEQVDAALLRQRSDGRRLGEILVELGACDWKDVYEALALQTRPTESPDAQARSPGSRAQPVMVVDDSALACDVISQGLREAGYQVVSFQDPFEALENVFRLKPLIVLSDLEMPGLDGLELCRRLKSGPSRAVPVIIVTAKDGDDERIGLLRAGADDCVGKGASFEEITARIESVLRRTGETDRVRRLFARYTSEVVVEQILASGAEVVLSGEKREVTAVFADLRGFTALAESLPPEHVVAILNEALGRLSDAVLRCGGTLDKFLGDGVMAVFGAPVRHGDDPLRAIQCARMMMDSIRELNRAPPEPLRALGLPPLRLGVGVNSGEVVTGSIGSEQRSDYTCIGDAVNVAARLCAAAAPGEILVGQRTRDLVGRGARFEPLAPLTLKGKSHPVPVFRARLERAA